MENQQEIVGGAVTLAQLLAICYAFFAKDYRLSVTQAPATHLSLRPSKEAFDKRETIGELGLGRINHRGWVLRRPRS